MSPRKELLPEELEFLRRWGFDEERFAAWQEAVRTKRLSKESNWVEGELQPPKPSEIDRLPRRDSPEAEELRALGAEAIRRGELGVVILNGGMATRFGGVVKGTVEVLEGRSFLGLNLQDVRRAQERFGGRIPVFLMNSFATDGPTREHLEDHGWFDLPADQVSCFHQFISVRLTPEGDIFTTEDGRISPYGPGHGDFAEAFRSSGCLARFLAEGGKHLMVSNVDNLGARVSALVLGHHLHGRAEVTVEVAPKWPGDVGGSPFVLDGKLQLVEQIRYPPGFDPDIVDVFNTNTFHFDANAIDRDFDLRWYYVDKEVDGRPAVQIERLIGEMTRFLESKFLRVKRSGDENRFLPVKTPEDLEAARDEVRELYSF